MRGRSDPQAHPRQRHWHSGSDTRRTDGRDASGVTAPLPRNTSLYFPDGLSDQVLATAPYAERPGRDTTNDTDTIFPTGGVPAVLDIAPSRDGFRAAACLVIVGVPAA